MLVVSNVKDETQQNFFRFRSAGSFFPPVSAFLLENLLDISEKF